MGSTSRLCKKPHAHLVSLKPSTGAVEQVEQSVTLGSSQFSLQRLKQAAFVGAGSERLFGGLRLDARAISTKKLTAMSDQLKDFRIRLGGYSMEVHDGAQIEGVLIKPVGFESIKE